MGLLRRHTKEQIERVMRGEDPVGYQRDPDHAMIDTNVDEGVATIRSSADAAEARERLMERRWPAHDIVEYLRLIDDPLQSACDGNVGA